MVGPRIIARKLFITPTLMKAIFKSETVRELMIFSGLMGLAVVASAVLTEPAFAAGLIDSSDNISAISDATGGESSIKALVQTLLNFFLSFLGFVATVMVIYGGILYVVSAGNDENVGKAKKILLYAVVGIVIILLSFALINTILGAGLAGGGTTT